MRPNRTPPADKDLSLQPGDNEETTISASKALKISWAHGKKVTIATLHKWIDAFNQTHKPVKLGHQPAGNGGRYYVFKLRFFRFINGEED